MSVCRRRPHSIIFEFDRLSVIGRRPGRERRAPPNYTLFSSSLSAQLLLWYVLCNIGTYIVVGAPSRLPFTRALVDKK